MKVKAWKNVLFIVAISIICVIFFCIAGVIVLMGGADFRTYPFQKADRWVCEEPHFEIDFENQTSGSYIEWNGEIYRVEVGIHADSFDVFLQSEDGLWYQENIILRCTWEYEGDAMKVKIDVDHLFDGAYEELIFTPQ